MWRLTWHQVIDQPVRGPLDYLHGTDRVRHDPFRPTDQWFIGLFARFIPGQAQLV